MDVLILSSSPRLLAHLFDLGMSFEVSHEGPIGGGDHVINALDGLIEGLLQVLIDLRFS